MFASRAEITKLLFSLKEKVPGAEDLLSEMKKGLPFAQVEERAEKLLAEWKANKGKKNV